MLPRAWRLGASFVAGAGVGLAAGYYLAVYRRAPRPAERRHPALKYGSPPSNEVRIFEHYVVSFNKRLRNPEWVVERITKDTSRGETSRENVQFYEDDGVDKRFRNRLTDFRNSGYDRGHMAPAANHKDSAKAMQDTFSMSNIAPQVGKGFNRDYWARFERFIKQLTNSCEEVYIVTGTLYLPRKTPTGYVLEHSMIGEPPRMVAVPTHFYKVVLGELPGGRGEAAVGAFVMPNAPIDPETPLMAFAVPLAALEEAAGCSFFPEYVSDARRAALDETALAFQRIGQQQRALQTAASRGALEEQFLLPAAAAGAVERTAEPVGLAALSGVEEPAGPSNGKGGASGKANGNGKAALRRSQSAPLAATAPPTPTMLPKTGPGGMGAVHVCEHTECRLPAEDWYAAGIARRKAQQALKGGKAETQGDSSEKPVA